MDFDIIVVGGGLAGASLAAALAGSPHRIAVLEARPPVPASGWDARVYAISPAAAGFLSDIGIWQHLDAGRISPVHSMRIRGDDNGRLDFSAYDSGLAELAWIVESGRLHHELWETIKRQRNVTLIGGVAPGELAHGRDSVTLRMPDGRSLHARLIVGADGVNSWVRAQAGIGAELRPYGERGVVANFRCARPHRQRAFQWFREDGILALLPLPGGMVSMVWSCPEALADELCAASAEALARRVGDATGGELGALEVVTPAQAFPLRFMRVAELTRPRVALIGDAAHAIHPLSGHGINLGFLDAQALGDVLRELPQWQDPGDSAVLRKYARMRAEEPLILQYATHGLNRLFASRNPLLAFARNVGLNLTGQLPVVRNTLVRYATSGRL